MTSLNCLKVLVVDDECDIRTTLKDVLELYGATVDTAASGNAAMAALQTGAFRKYDIVLSDVRMLDGDGVSLLQQVRQLHPTRPAFFFMTGFMDYTVAELIAIGATDVFAKPFDIEAIVRRFSRHYAEIGDSL